MAVCRRTDTHTDTHGQTHGPLTRHRCEVPVTRVDTAWAPGRAPSCCTAPPLSLPICPRSGLSWGRGHGPDLLGSQAKARRRPAHTHLSEGPWQAAELIGCVQGHHGHGGRGDGPAQRVGPLREDVGAVAGRPEGHNADHNHKLQRGHASGVLGWGEAEQQPGRSPHALDAGQAPRTSKLRWLGSCSRSLGCEGFVVGVPQKLL